MLGNWLRRRIQRAGVKGAITDLERFVVGLRRQSPEDIGMLVAVATILRVNLRSEGKLPDEVLRLGTLVPQDKQADTQWYVSRLIRRFQKMKRPSDAAGAMVWLHSLRAYAYPEVRLLARQMWGELERGFPHAFDALRFIEQTTGRSLPLGSLQASHFVPEGLEPPKS